MGHIFINCINPEFLTYFKMKFNISTPVVSASHDYSLIPTCVPTCVVCNEIKNNRFTFSV